MITVRNADGEPDTQAQIIIQNKIGYAPKVSVIIPVYNTKKYLRDCLDSVITQTLKEIEIICVDDGSTDGSLSILKKYAKKDNRITVMAQDNSGAGIARNAGLEIAMGEYLLILDSDDIFDHKFIEKLYNQAYKTDAEITMCRMSLLDNQTKQVQKATWTLKVSLIPAEVFGAEDVKNHTFTFCVGWSWDKLYRADFVRKHNLKFQNLRSSNDLLFVFMSVALAQRMTVVDDYLILHRSNTFTSISQTRSKSPLCFVKAMIKLKEKLSAYGLYGLHERAFVNWAADFCLWHVRTIDSEAARKIIYEYLKKNLDTIMDLHLDDPDYYYDKKILLALKSLLNPLKVSVVMPCYNIAPYLRQALDSVVNQTLKDIEIICVNDGSTDDTLDIIKEYAERDKRIVVIDGPNGGYGKAMNKGLDACRGEYIGILEPDDYLALDMYETQYKVAKENDLDFVKADFYRFIGQDYTLNRLSKNPEDYNMVCKPIEKLETFLFIMNTWTGIYRRDFIQRFKIRHNETPGASFQDNGFFVQTFCFAERVMFLDKPFYMNRRDNPNSSIKRRDAVYSMNENYRYIKEVLVKNNLFDKMKEIYEILKFKNYMFTLQRIDDLFKLRYVVDISDEFRTDLQKYNISYNFFDQQQKDKIYLLMYSPVEFFNKYVANTLSNTSYPLLYKDIGLGCNTWCYPNWVDGNTYTYDLQDNIYMRYVSWDPIQEGSCDIEILYLFAIEKRSKRVVEFPVDKIISSGKITGNKVEFRNQKGCWIGFIVEGAYESLTIEATVSRV